MVYELADNQYLKNIFMKCYTANQQIQAYMKIAWGTVDLIFIFLIFLFLFFIHSFPSLLFIIIMLIIIMNFIIIMLIITVNY